MKVLGYSERGAVNSLVFEIAYSAQPTTLLERLLEHALFPVGYQLAKPISCATVLVEQSLSDFGDADAILLLDSDGAKSAMFIEAKVKSSQAGCWSIKEEFAKFQDGLLSTVSSSNLFTQLYHKIRFAEAACSKGQQLLHAGIAFPGCSTKGVRRIGSNRVVLRAVEMIVPYLERVWYMALVPDSASNIDPFIRDVLRTFKPTELEAWDTSRWGFLCWSDVHEFCRSEGLNRTAAVLDFNESQIY